MVVLGHINYLNCIPVHGGIITGKIPFKGRIVQGNPSELNLLLKRGEIDVSPSSSVELVNGYKVLPGLSISGKEDVKSIILFSRRPLERISKGLFYITSHSATSSMLIKVILKEFFSVEADYKTFDPDKLGLHNVPLSAAGVLFIGDSALKLSRQADPLWHRYDLAEIWHKKTGLPFTFALWQVSTKAAKNPEIKNTLKTLQDSYGFFRDNSELMAKEFAGQFKMPVADILEYWGHLSFDLTPAHTESLKMFFGLCRKLGLIKSVPDICFL